MVLTSWTLLFHLNQCRCTFQAHIDYCILFSWNIIQWVWNLKSGINTILLLFLKHQKYTLKSGNYKWEKGQSSLLFLSFVRRYWSSRLGTERQRLLSGFTRDDVVCMCLATATCSDYNTIILVLYIHFPLSFNYFSQNADCGIWLDWATCCVILMTW